MRLLLDTLLRLRGVTPDLPGTPPDAALMHPTAALLSHAWLAPHAAHLAVITARATQDDAAPPSVGANGNLR